MRSFALNLANLPHKFKAAFGAQAKHFKFAVKFGDTLPFTPKLAKSSEALEILRIIKNLKMKEKSNR